MWATPSFPLDGDFLPFYQRVQEHGRGSLPRLRWLGSVASEAGSPGHQELKLRSLPGVSKALKKIYGVSAPLEKRGHAATGARVKELRGLSPGRSRAVWVAGPPGTPRSRPPRSSPADLPQQLSGTRLFFASFQLRLMINCPTAGSETTE